jgi:hypothetical protein
MSRPAKRRHGGKARPAGRWERAEVIAAAVRLAVAILDLMRDHLIGGPGPGRLP